MAAQPYPDEATWWNWYATEVGNRYHEAGLPFPDNQAAFIWFSRCGYSIGAGVPKEIAAARHLRELDEALGLNPPDPIPGDKIVRPIVGYVRTDNNNWADDSGLRSFRICSWFPAIRCFRDKPDEVKKQLDSVAKYWQGVRIFWHLGTSYWVDAGKNVDPRWPDFDSLFTSLLLEFQRRGLRASLTSGDMQVLCPDGNEDSWHEHIYRLAASVDQTTVSWSGAWNEAYRPNTARPDPAYGARLCSLRQNIYPWGAHSISDAPGGEEPTELDSWSRTPSNFTLVHGARVFPDSLRRAFNLTRQSANTRSRWLIDQDEPVGAGPDVYQRDDDPRHLFGLYSLHLICGQMTTFFGGHGIKAWQQAGDLEKDWGFTELPELWKKMEIPENIATWTIKAGHEGDAAIYPRVFSNTGSGPDRCDGAQTGNRAWFVVSGGTGQWEMISRRNGHIRVWDHMGIAWEGSVSTGTMFLTVSASDSAALVFELES